MYRYCCYIIHWQQNLSWNIQKPSMEEHSTHYRINRVPVTISPRLQLVDLLKSYRRLCQVLYCVIVILLVVGKSHSNMSRWVKYINNQRVFTRFILTINKIWINFVVFFALLSWLTLISEYINAQIAAIITCTAIMHYLCASAIVAIIHVGMWLLLKQLFEVLFVISHMPLIVIIEFLVFDLSTIGNCMLWRSLISYCGSKNSI